MSEWREVRLGDLCERVTVGHVGRMADQYVDDGVPFLRSQNVKPFAITTKGMLRIDQAFHRKLSKSALAAGDVVVVRTGYPGTAAVVPPALDGSNCADLVVITPGEDLNPHLLAAVFNSSWGRSAVGGQLVGAAQQHFNVGSAKMLRISLPARRVQDQIAEVLCAFHDLMENNRRCVEVLEEVAQAIYREWFIHFRYTGHEGVPLVDSTLGPIPDGWAALTFGDVLELQYGKALKKEDRRGGSVAVVSSAGVVGWHDQPLVQGPTIVVGRKGNVGSVTWVDADAWPIDTAYFVRSELPLRYVAEQLRRTEFLNTHAAVPGLSRDQAYSRPFLRPTASLMEAFDAISGTLAAEARILDHASERLGDLRDLLLPKLVTGQIDVSHLDLEALTTRAVA